MPLDDMTGSANPDATDPNKMIVGYQQQEGSQIPIYGTTPEAQTAIQQQGAQNQWDAARSNWTGNYYSPDQLGWDDATAKRLSDAGITQLPGWFSHENIYGGNYHLGEHDPVANYIDLYNTPIDQGTNQWGAATKAYNSLGAHDLPDIVNDPAFKDLYTQRAFNELNNAKDSWWDRNQDWVIGLGGLATVAAGGIAGEAGLLGAGAEAGAGTGAGATEAGVTGAGITGSAAQDLAAGGMLGSLGTTLPDATGILSAGITPTMIGQLADVGMGNGTSWLTDLGLPASYGNDLGALAGYLGDSIDWTKLGTSGLSKLLGGGLGGMLGGTTTPVAATGTSGATATSPPQTSQIQPMQAFGAGSPMTPATMPTGSVMGAFAPKVEDKDYLKYFSSIF